MRIPLLVWAAAAVSAQTADPYQRARAAVEQSAEKQRQAVEKQRASVRAQLRTASQADSFFTAGWTSPLIPVAMPPTEPECTAVPEEAIGPLVAQIAQREGLTPDLLRAVIERESAYLPCAVSRKGAQGLMQLMPSTAADLGVSDAFDPQQNLSAGARFLRQLLDRYGGNLALALGAYNAGPRRVDTLGRLPLFPETVSYVSDILGKLGGGSTAEPPR